MKKYLILFFFIHTLIIITTGDNAFYCIRNNSDLKFG